MAPARPNPMIAAVLREIPGPDSTRSQRVTWLRMIAMAMDTVYGAPDGAIELPDFLGSQPQGETAPAAKPAAAAPAKPEPLRVVRVAPIPRFFIGLDSRALRNFRVDGAGALEILEEPEPLFAHEINGDTLFDDRGEHGDLGSIIWADGSRGVLGKRLNISATPTARTA